MDWPWAHWGRLPAGRDRAPRHSDRGPSGVHKVRSQGRGRKSVGLKKVQLNPKPYHRVTKLLRNRAKTIKQIFYLSTLDAASALKPGIRFFSTCYRSAAAVQRQVLP